MSAWRYASLNIHLQLTPSGDTAHRASDRFTPEQRGHVRANRLLSPSQVRRCSLGRARTSGNASKCRQSTAAGNSPELPFCEENSGSSGHETRRLIPTDTICAHPPFHTTNIQLTELHLDLSVTRSEKVRVALNLRELLSHGVFVSFGSTDGYQRQVGGVGEAELRQSVAEAALVGHSKVQLFALIQELLGHLQHSAEDRRPSCWD